MQLQATINGGVRVTNKGANVIGISQAHDAASGPATFAEAGAHGAGTTADGAT